MGFLVFCPFVTHHGRPHRPSQPKIYILKISKKYHKKSHSNGSKPVCVSLNLQRLIRLYPGNGGSPMKGGGGWHGSSSSAPTTLRLCRCVFYVAMNIYSYRRGELKQIGFTKCLPVKRTRLQRNSRSNVIFLILY